MIRTQIYLTSRENKVLNLLAGLEKRTKSEIIRGIIDEKLGPGAPRVAAAAARKALGAWGGCAGQQTLRRLRSRW
ncbi:MAG: hypothetical protein A2V88_05405 [Elusimicrobia bacterium RBG_16_66_12]|nr:MAG: hypothetical protein A2V88_05405 [Elusimicrobia bacterium RBG_16_66_12]